MARFRTVALIVVFATQALGLIWARFVPTRYLTWAPFHEISSYRIDAVVAGTHLEHHEALLRYGIPGYHTDGPARRTLELNSIHHVFDIVQTFEASTAPAQADSVIVTYRINGDDEQTWEWVPDAR